MTTIIMQSAIQKRLKTITPDIVTLFGNESTDATLGAPVEGSPYQRVSIQFTKPDNPERTSSYIQLGLMDVVLLYPLNEGEGAARARAELIRATFPYGLALTQSGVTTNVTDVAEIAQGFRDGDRWAQPVRVPFYAHLVV